MSDKRRREEKTFIFPENVTSSYGVFLGLSLKDIIIYLAPVVVLGIISFIIPPQTVKATIGKLIIFLALLTIVIALLVSQPVAYRSNIKLVPHLRLMRNHNKRQHLFYKSKKKKR